MDQIDQHISKYFLHFQNEEDTSFQEVFALIQSKVKDKYNLLLRYIHLLLNETFLEEKSETKTLHLHFEYDFNDDPLIVIAQYLLIRFFKESSKTTASSSPSSEKIEFLKTNLCLKLKILSKTCPPEASGKNGGNRPYKNWKKEIRELQTLVDFYNQLNNDVEISTSTLFNCQVRLSEFLCSIFSTRPYACKIEEYDKYPSFNILNTKLTLNQIDEIDNSIIDNLETVILFDCERKKLMQYFSLQDIRDYDIELGRYLIITFGTKRAYIQSLKDKINLIQSRFKIARNDSYPIIRSEIDYSLGQMPKEYIPVSFIGVDTSQFWDAFILETNIQDLYELRSIRMMNLYSLCFNEEIKEFILQEIFSENHTSSLISDETKQNLLDLSKEDLSILQESLGNVLDLIVSANLNQIIINKAKRETVFIVDGLVLELKLSKLISSSLLLTERNKLLSWSDFNTIEDKAVIILSYQDQGKYPYYFYPNIIETTISRYANAEAFYHKFLFSNRYQWAKYNILKERYNLLKHPIRKKYFDWTKLKDSINDLKPQKDDDTNWYLEQQYSRNSDRETVKLKLKDERERTFNSSELFIYSTDDSSFKVERIGDIIESIDEDIKYFVHQLDEIQESINLYEKMIDTKKLEEELNVIRQKFQIDNTETGRLWKILLKKKTLPSGEETLYNELKEHLQKKGLRIVSLYHFKNNWLNPESNSLAPLNKKVFIELCEFLDIPKVYFTLIQRLRNASKQASRQSTLQMNRLLQDLFNDGCFDDGTNLNKIIAAKLEGYKQKHPLDELGIDERHLGENLIALVELIKPEITLKEIVKFKKAE